MTAFWADFSRTYQGYARLESSKRDNKKARLEAAKQEKFGGGRGGGKDKCEMREVVE